MAEAKRWWDRDAAPGCVLLAAAILSFVLINGPTGPAFERLLETSFGVAGVGAGAHPLNLHRIINDGLMVLFFLYAGLELKRETVEGPFKNPREAALPLAGALGGMIAPALIYLALTAATPQYARGWAIPAATDIAFAIGVLSLLGSRAPPGLRLFLLALAIIDDLGAIIIIALFYSTHLVGWALGGAAVTFAAMLVMNRSGVRALGAYWLAGVALWGFMLLSGVHPTVAGVLTAMAAPMPAGHGGSPLIAAEQALKPWVLFAIMPIFALANAGVALDGVAALTHPIALGAGLGLVLGKPLGIGIGTYTACALLKRHAPGTPAEMLGLGMLAGTGFTMSLFIGALAFGSGELAAPVRFGVLGGSFISAAAGLLVLWLACARRAAPSQDALAAEEDIAERRGVLENLDAPKRE